VTADTLARMDRMYRHQRYVYDLTRKFYLLGRDGLIDRLAPRSDAHILEIGSGTGRNLVALARRYPLASLYGIDASAAMLDTARHMIARAGLANRIRLAHGLGEKLDAQPMFGLDRRFDAIVISYALTMIPGWPPVIDKALENLAPGGQLAIVDFWDQRNLPAWFRHVLQAWLALFDVRPHSDMPDIIRARLDRGGGKVAEESLFGGYAFRLVYTAPG
jgi:S-adenosylmethionine-diacylgycerolhomoserine-N-methlytransferase